MDKKTGTPDSKKQKSPPAKSPPANSPQLKSTETEPGKREMVQLSGIYAFKLSMSSVYDDKGHRTSVTFLKFKPWVVSQVKTQEKEGYSGVQLAFARARKNKKGNKAMTGHLSSLGFSTDYVREIRQNKVAGIKRGQELSIHSLQKGDRVTVQAISKGHGFAGVV